MPSFKVPCPSCEAPVLIKNPNLVGTKVECPKCKYRFKVEEPAATAADAKPGEAKPADAKDKKAAKTGKKKLVPVLVGVGAVVLLAVVGFAVLGGGDGKKGGPKGGGPGPMVQNPNGVNPGDGNTEDPKDKTKVDPPTPTIPFSTKNITHLLPGQTIAVYRFNMTRLRESPAYEALADPQVTGMFQSSMGFPVDDVETYIHCFAGDGREPFAVLKLRVPTKAAEVTTKMALQPKPKTIKSRELHAVRSNPFVAAIGRAFSMKALLGDIYEQVPMALPADAKEKPLGVCVYDTQHILIGDFALLERFLGELDADGYPPFKTALNVTPAPATPAPGTPPGTAGAAPLAPPGAPPATPPAAPPATPPATPADNRPYTSTDTYRTVEFPLKKALDELETDRLMPPMFVFAEKFDVRHYDPKLMKKEYNLLSATLDPIAARTQYVSGNVVTYSARNLTANLRVTLASIEDARTVVKDQLHPGLSVTADFLRLILQTQVEFRDYTLGGTTPNPNGGIPGDPSNMYQPPGGMGSSLGPPPMPGGGGSSLGPPPMPGGGGSSLGPPPMPGGGSSLGPPPLGTGGKPGFGQPDPDMGGMPQVPGMMDPNQPPPTVSRIDLGMIDKQILIAIDLSWSDEVNRTKVAPRLVGITNQIKGKMAIFSSEFSWHAIAAAGPKAEEGLKMFPRGTADRKSNGKRWSLAYPPVQRVSLFADLLPYMGRDQLARSINKNAAWYDKGLDGGRGNIDAAGEWVPELLVPYYPQSAWRATSPLAPDYVLGATNYVAIAGVGLDIAREDPTDPNFKTKVGITGYGWGSKAAEVTDGLSNTIYMIQTPPGLQQPWIAGGGATVRGFDENDPMAGFKYTHPGRTKQGTYALMGDGSVRWIPADIDPKVLLAMATRAGGDNAALADVDKTAPKVEAPKPPVELKTEPKVEPKKPEDKKPEDKKGDPKATEPKKPEDKKDPGAKGDTAPPPAEKK